MSPWCDLEIDGPAFGIFRLLKFVHSFMIPEDAHPPTQAVSGHVLPR
jgi:hypothetical protein